MNLGLKEPYLVYWLCFGLGLVDCNPQLMNICIKEILGVLGEILSKFLKFRMVVISSSELRFGCSWTLWKAL